VGTRTFIGELENDAMGFWWSSTGNESHDKQYARFRVVGSKDDSAAGVLPKRGVYEQMLNSKTFLKLCAKFTGRNTIAPPYVGCNAKRHCHKFKNNNRDTFKIFSPVNLC